MPPFLDRFQRWLHTVLVDHAQVQPEATWESIHRMRILAALGFLINVGYMTYFWRMVPASADAWITRYNNTIGAIHAISAAGMVVLWVWLHQLCRAPQSSPLVQRLAQVLACAWTLAFGISLALADQWVGSNTTNYVIVCLVVAMLGLLRPLASTALLAAAYLLLYTLLPQTQASPAMLDMARSHSFSATVLSAVASIVMWRQYVTAAVLRRELTRSNASLEKKQQELSYLATHDALTGLHNRRAFLLEAEHELSRALRYPCETGVLVADLDFFKRVNDQYGHPAGDAVLCHFATVLKAQLRTSDIAARLGGEEFIVLLPGTGRTGTETAAEKIRQAIAAQPVQHGGHTIAVTVSIGASTLPAHTACTIEALYGQADQALYRAKADGRNRVVHAGMDTNATSP